MVSPFAVPYHPVLPDQRANAIFGVTPPDLVYDTQPDIIVTLEIFELHGLLAEPWFDEMYTPIITLDGEWVPWDSGPLYLFSRYDFEPGLALDFQ